MPKKQENVDDYLSKLDHPLKAETEALRAIIKGVNPKISEQIKWNAPSYSYSDKEYIATFNFHNQQQLRLVFHNPHIASIQNAILEGDYPDRRIVYFASMSDVDAKRADLVQVISELIKMMDVA
ncbi:MAG: DUF1801 domain-containing protein [Anaerolineae bacterium]|nr:DUF1801 domain-containing protein [Anaerolineae bacterium]